MGEAAGLPPRGVEGGEEGLHQFGGGGQPLPGSAAPPFCRLSHGSGAGLPLGQRGRSRGRNKTEGLGELVVWLRGRSPVCRPEGPRGQVGSSERRPLGSKERASTCHHIMVPASCWRHSALPRVLPSPGSALIPLALSWPVARPVLVVGLPPQPELRFPSSTPPTPAVKGEYTSRS